MALLENENVNHQKRILSHVHLYSFEHQQHRERQQHRQMKKCVETKDSQETHPIQIEFLSSARIFMFNFHLRFVLDPFLCAIVSHKRKFILVHSLLLLHAFTSYFVNILMIN